MPALPLLHSLPVPVAIFWWWMLASAAIASPMSSHGFLSRDGDDPAEIAAIARRQLLTYPTVTWRDTTVVSAAKNDTGFVVTDTAGTAEQGMRLLLALGLKDELPAVPGLAERWGRHVFHCPYCHGYEIVGDIRVLNAAEHSIHHALMLPDWGPTSFFLDGKPMPNEEDRAKLAARGVTVVPEKIREIAGAADVVLEGGKTIRLGGLFTASKVSPSSSLAAQLGCTMEENPMGTVIATNQMKETSVAGVFACGDVARAAGNVAIAVGDGTFAGASVHRTLMFGNL